MTTVTEPIPIVPVHTSVAAASLVAKLGAGQIFGYSGTNGATAGYVMVFDAIAVPSNGTVGTTLIECFQVAANGFFSSEDAASSLVVANGVTIVLSSTGPYTLTIQTGAANLGYITARVQ